MSPSPDPRAVPRSAAVLLVAAATTLCLAAVPAPAPAQPTSPTPPPGTPTAIGPEEILPGTSMTIDLSTQTVDGDHLATVDETAHTAAATLNANIAFDKDRAELKPAAIARLRALVGELRGTPPSPIDIAGYTDNLGSHAHGVDLSERRARAVREVLEPELPGFNFTSRGLAEADPVAPNDTEENRARNRRVEITYPRPTPAHTPTPARPATPVPANPTSSTLEADGSDGGRYTIAVGPLRRQGRLTRLDLTITELRPRAPGKYPELPFVALPDPVNIIDRSAGSPTGVVLIDHATGLEHRPASGHWRAPTSPELPQPNQCFPQPQQVIARTRMAKVTTTCWYASPTADTVDVTVGTAGTVRGVPVR